MKNGILTFHRTTNFGSFLQAFALWYKINSLGYESEIIDYRCEAVEERENVTKKNSGTLKSRLISALTRPGNVKKFNNLMSFLQSNAKVSRSYDKKTIRNSVDEYGKFIVGSDIVWGTDITNNDYTYFLDFVKDRNKKYAFSSSIGDYQRYSAEETEKIASLLESFSKIAVRETDAAKWIKTVSNQTPECVCDPTMLLSSEEWDKIIVPKKYKSDYVLIYFTDEKGKAYRDAVQYAQKHRLKVYYITNSIKPIKNVKIVRPKTLSEFIGLIKNAKFIFTASYHGMLFSTYYSKDFLFYTRVHSSRVISLADKLGLEKQCGDEKEIFEYEKINYGEVKKKTQDFRNYSISILQGMLKSE